VTNPPGRPQTVGLTGRVQLERRALVYGLGTYHPGRVENLRDAVGGSAS
jgi:hypothetical protein